MNKFFLALVLFVVSLGGCTMAPKVMPEVKLTPEQIVTKKANDRWALMIAGDFSGAYKYISPAGKAVWSYEAFSRPIKTGYWNTVKVTSAVCEGEVCKVNLEMLYNIAKTTNTREFDETWIKDGDDWWLVFVR